MIIYIVTTLAQSALILSCGGLVVACVLDALNGGLTAVEEQK